ncbi:group II intron reverse transcriptase/maturase [Acidobacteria bacterium AH-259-A15]|nr:group II intron reverse transcriptase/maturase [Acidobacteria bacterium AH-259-A15]
MVSEEELAPSSEVQYPSGRPCSGDGLSRNSVFLPGEISRPPQGSGNRRGRKDKAVKGREKSDGCVVPKGRRKAASTGRKKARGGKATTASQPTVQPNWFAGTADSPKGDVAGTDLGEPGPVPSAVPKPVKWEESALPTMRMEAVVTWDNLMKAFEHVEANQGAPGPDGQTIEQVREQLPEILPRLQTELLKGEYGPGMIRRVWIPKSGGGQRGLGIPDVIDRWIQQAVYQILSPHYEPTFHASSHGFRPERSCYTAITEAFNYVEEGYEWVVDLDLEKFFDLVCQDRLISRLEQKVKDRKLIQLIRRMFKAKVVLPDGVVIETEAGVPQGGPLSPLLSNIVLDELDWELDWRGHHFVRYADDCNIYVRSERSGQRVMASITRFIDKRLRLKVNASKSAVARPEKRHFLGFRLRRNPEDGTVEVLLSKRSKERIEARIRELTPRNWGQSLRDCIRQVNVYLQGWAEFFHICSEAELQTLRGLDAHIRRRLRALLLKQWKRKRTRVQRLIRLGVRPKAAWNVVYKGRRRLWALSHAPAVERGLRNAFFAERGLVSLATWFSVRNSWNVTVPSGTVIQLGLTLG